MQIEQHYGPQAGTMDLPTSNMTIYEIRIMGQLEARWEGWFDNLSIQLEVDGNTLLTGPLPDQAALHGVLKKIRNLGLTLISVNSYDQDVKEGHNL